MNEDLAQKLAGYIADYLPQRLWPLLLVQLVLTLVAASAGAFFGEYFKTRGKNLATKADFESLTKQLRTNTELVETIKAEIGHKDWAKREWTNLRRIKLEELLQKVHDSDEYLNLYRAKAMEGKLGGERDPILEFDTIASLYFPKIRKEASDFSFAHKQEKRLYMDLALNILAAGQDSVACGAAFEDFHVKYNPSKTVQTAETLTEAARRLLVDILDVKDE